jgi:hypothetical protein
MALHDRDARFGHEHHVAGLVMRLGVPLQHRRRIVLAAQHVGAQRPAAVGAALVFEVDWRRRVHGLIIAPPVATGRQPVR